MPGAAALTMSSADVSAAVKRVAGFWGPPSPFWGAAAARQSWVSCESPAVRAWSLKVPHAMGHPCAAGPPGSASPGGGAASAGGCDHICGDTCADYGKWVNLPAAGGGLAGGGSWQGPARGRVRPQWPPLSPRSPGCQAVTRDMARGRGSGTRLLARPQPAWPRCGGSRWLRHGAVWPPQVHQVCAAGSLPRLGAPCHQIPVSGGVAQPPACRVPPRCVPSGPVPAALVCRLSPSQRRLSGAALFPARHSQGAGCRRSLG